MTSTQPKLLKPEWSKHLRGTDKENFEASIKNSIVALSRLNDLVKEQETLLYREETKKEDFTDPNWAYKQAYRNGQKTSFRYIKELLSFLN